MGMGKTSGNQPGHVDVSGLPYPPDRTIGLSFIQRSLGKAENEGKAVVFNPKPV